MGRFVLKEFVHVKLKGMDRSPDRRPGANGPDDHGDSAAEVDGVGERRSSCHVVAVPAGCPARSRLRLLMSADQRAVSIAADMSQRACSRI